MTGFLAISLGFFGIGSSANAAGKFHECLVQQIRTKSSDLKNALGRAWSAFTLTHFRELRRFDPGQFEIATTQFTDRLRQGLPLTDLSIQTPAEIWALFQAQSELDGITYIDIPSLFKDPIPVPSNLKELLTYPGRALEQRRPIAMLSSAARERESLLLSIRDYWLRPNFAKTGMSDIQLAALASRLIAFKTVPKLWMMEDLAQQEPNPLSRLEHIKGWGTRRVIGLRKFVWSTKAERRKRALQISQAQLQALLLTQGMEATARAMGFDKDPSWWENLGKLRQKFKNAEETAWALTFVWFGVKYLGVDLKNAYTLAYPPNYNMLDSLKIYPPKLLAKFKASGGKIDSISDDLVELWRQAAKNGKGPVGTTPLAKWWRYQKLSGSAHQVKLDIRRKLVVCFVFQLFYITHQMIPLANDAYYYWRFAHLPHEQQVLAEKAEMSEADFYTNQRVAQVLNGMQSFDDESNRDLNIDDRVVRFENLPGLHDDEDMTPQLNSDFHIRLIKLFHSKPENWNINFKNFTNWFESQAETPLQKKFVSSTLATIETEYKSSDRSHLANPNEN